MHKIEVYTDGSSLGNPGRGGWGAIFLGQKNVVELGEKHNDVTNNQMELLAVAKAFEFLAEKNIKDYLILIKSDSKYFIDGIEKWIIDWQNNNWKTANKKPVKNQNLWKQILEFKIFLETDNKLIFEHVKAHSGIKYNERVDDIARMLAGGEKIELFEGKRLDYKI